MQNKQRSLVPCTALGCMELLSRSEIDLHGKEAVLMGDSNVVGTPLAMLLRSSGVASLTLCRLFSSSSTSFISAIKLCGLYGLVQPQRRAVFSCF